ncbi:hypothetical protein D3C71_2101210 [compost metagenome]
MQHSADLAELATGKALEKVVLVQVVGNLAIGEVAKLVSISQVVDRNNLGFIASIEGLDQVATDETGGAGDDNGHALSPFEGAERSV